MTVVVGTAGHIDHGKTSLLRALTGIDPDRLPEEQRRGMTIDVGYAHLELAGGGVGGPQAGRKARGLASKSRNLMELRYLNP